MTKTRQERIAEIEEVAHSRGVITPNEYALITGATAFEYADGYNGGLHNGQLFMAREALQIIRELEAELKIAKTALYSVIRQDDGYSSVKIACLALDEINQLNKQKDNESN